MVYIFLGTGFEEAEAIVPADLLRRAGVEVSLVGLSGSEVTGAHNITVKADLTVDKAELSGLQALVLPGGMGGVTSILHSPRAMELIKQVYEEKNAYLAAICAAPTILGALGFLKGRRAVCYPGMEDQLTGAIPCTSEKAVVDGKLVTGQGPGAAFDFGLKLVELLKGEAAARQVQDGTHYRH